MELEDKEKIIALLEENIQLRKDIQTISRPQMISSEEVDAASFKFFNCSVSDLRKMKDFAVAHGWMPS